MNAGWIVAIICAIAVAAYFTAQHKKKANAGVTAKANDWRVFYSVGNVTIRAQGAGFVLGFPQKPGHVDYVQRVANLPQLQYGQTLVMQCTVTGSGFTAHETPTAPPKVTLMLRRADGDDSDMSKYETYRQYSAQALVLDKPGTYTLAVKLDEVSFGGVLSSHDKASFQAVLDNLESIGPVFGADGGRGHGVYADAGATFVFLSLTVGD